MMKSLMLMATLLGVSFMSYAYTPLNTVEKVDLNRYQGTWYEIAKFPNRFQKKCAASRANYTLNANSTVKVHNECQKKKNGKIMDRTGRAYAIDSTNSKLKVTFVPWLGRLAEGDYYIMALADDYSYVLVGAPDRKYLWILAREKVIDQNIINELLSIAHNEGFDITRIKMSSVWNE